MHRSIIIYLSIYGVQGMAMSKEGLCYATETDAVSTSACHSSRSERVVHSCACEQVVVCRSINTKVSSQASADGAMDIPKAQPRMDRAALHTHDSEARASAHTQAAATAAAAATSIKESHETAPSGPCHARACTRDAGCHGSAALT